MVLVLWILSTDIITKFMIKIAKRDKEGHYKILSQSYFCLCIQVLHISVFWFYILQIYLNTYKTSNKNCWKRWRRGLHIITGLIQHEDKPIVNTYTVNSRESGLKWLLTCPKGCIKSKTIVMWKFNTSLWLLDTSTR